MRCRGCGSKVGAAVLERVLGRIDPGNLPDVVLGLEAGEDAAALSVPPGQTLLQSVDMFPAIVDDPYIFGRIAANHSSERHLRQWGAGPGRHWPSLLCPGHPKTKWK